MAVKKAAELNLFGNTKCGQKRKTIRRTGRSLKEKQNQPPEVFCKKKVLLETSQNSQENTCARASFLIKLQAEACKISKNTFFTKHLWATLLFEKLSTKIFNHLTT